MAVNQSLLTSLVRTYPQGGRFVFDENGPIQFVRDIFVTEGSQNTTLPRVAEEKRTRRQFRKRADMLRLLTALSGGQIDIRSKPGEGTKVKLSLPLENRLSDSVELSASLDSSSDDEVTIHTVRRRARGRTVQIRGSDASFGDSELRRSALASLKDSIEKYATKWFDLSIVEDDQPADVVIFDESSFSNTRKVARSNFRLLLILCNNSDRREIYKTSRLKPGQFVEFVSTPCGPHRCAKALLNCLDAEAVLENPKIKHQPSVDILPKVITLKEPPAASTTMRISSKPVQSQVPQSVLKVAPTQDPLETLSQDSTNASNETSGEDSSYDTPASGMSFLGLGSPDLKLPSPSDPMFPTKPKMLLVEDNPVSMMLLATYMKKNGWEYEKATKGLIAMQAFQARPKGFDVIFMDVFMPIMTGFESTRAIRAIELERRTAYSAQQNLLSNPRYSQTSPLLFPIHPNSYRRFTTFPFKAPPAPSPPTKPDVFP